MITHSVILKLNEYESMPPTELIGKLKFRDGYKSSDFMEELIGLDKLDSKKKKMKHMTEGEILNLQIEHLETIDKLKDKYFKWN